MAVRITKSAVNIREKLAELERPVGITGAALMKTETPQEAFSLIGARNCNMIINGAMMVNQRGFTGAAGTTTNGAYTTDRFYIQYSHDGAVSAGQTTMNSTVGGSAYADGFQNALILRVTTADASLAAGQYQRIQQPIEGYNVQGIKKGTANAQPVTLSFWVRSSTTGTYIAELEDADNTRQVSKSYTIDTANTWEKKTLTFPADTTGVFNNDNTLALALSWWLAAGSTYSGGTLNTSWAASTNANRAVGQVNLLATAGNDFFLTGVQLEVGKVATEFEHRSIGEELALCERYCQGFPTGGRIAIGNWGSNTTAYCSTTLRTAMRTTPTLYSYTAGNVLVEGVNWYAATTVAITESTNTNITFYITGISNSGQSANANAVWGNGASCVIQAEL